jgi:pilin isopeptide linkage protein
MVTRVLKNVNDANAAVRRTRSMAPPQETAAVATREAARNTAAPTPRDPIELLVSTERDLRDAIDAIEDGGSGIIRFEDNIDIADAPLTIPSGKSVDLVGRNFKLTMTTQGPPVIDVLNNAYLSAGSLTITGSTSSGIRNQGTVLLTDSTVVTENHSKGNGAGIYNIGNVTNGIQGGILTMKNGARAANNTAQDGAGIYSVGPGAAVSIDAGAMVQKNTATGDGGGIYLKDGALSMTSSGYCVENMSDGNGGGLYIAADATADLVGCNIQSNTAQGDGGGIYIVGDVTSLRAMITVNTAHGNGGGIYYSGQYPLTVIQGTTIAANKTDGDGGGIALAHTSLNKLNVENSVYFTNNSAQAEYTGELAPGDQRLYDEHITNTNWTYPYKQGYNNYDISYDINDHSTGELVFYASKDTLGGLLTDGEFEFGLFDRDGNLLATAANDANGLIKFFAAFPPGDSDYIVKEITPRNNDWEIDTTEHVLHVYERALDNGEPGWFLSWNSGAPLFKNVRKNPTCGLVEFPELEFDEPGVYEYTLRELTPSGAGWLTDDAEYRVIITVTEDSNNILVATAEFPDGYPEFVDIYTDTITKFIISACKMAVGAPLPDGKFMFDLYDQNGKLIASTTNPAADETVVPQRDELIAAARAYTRRESGRVSVNGVTVGEPAPHRAIAVGNTERSGNGVCEVGRKAALRRLRDLENL